MPDLQNSQPTTGKLFCALLLPWDWVWLHRIPRWPAIPPGGVEISAPTGRNSRMNREENSPIADDSGMPVARRHY
jgi:hypothetical protein